MRKISEDYVGTCQACLGEYKVTDGDRKICLHGYTRPGTGYTIGRCEGVDHKPFEYDCALTRSIAVRHLRLSQDQALYADRLKAGEVKSLRREWREYVSAQRCYVDRSEVIGPDSVHWADVLRFNISGAENLAQYHADYACHLEKMVSSWCLGSIIGLDSPPTGRVRGLREAYDPERAKEDERKAAARAERAAKPGKLKLTLFWTCSPRVYLADDDRQAIKGWAKMTFPAGRVIVQEGSRFDLPRVRLMDFPQSQEFVVVGVHIDWSYLDQIEGIFRDFTRITHTAKKIEFAILFDGDQPWLRAAA